MVRQYKKILKKIHPKKKKWQEDKPKEKVGKDYLLIAVMSLTVLFLFFGWANFTIANKVLYVMLTVSLFITYARRHYNFNEKQDLAAERISYATMGIAMIAFVIHVYQTYFA